jgi:Protein of unknown function (DUF2934)
MKTQSEDMHTERGNSATNSEATDLSIEQALDHEAVALLVYYYWEARGRPHDSPHEDWFRAETELGNRLAATATD